LLAVKINPCNSKKQLLYEMKDHQCLLSPSALSADRCRHANGDMKTDSRCAMLRCDESGDFSAVVDRSNQLNL